MRGVIFTTFNEYVESTFGYASLDTLLCSHEYPNQGGFSSADAYSATLLVQLVEDLSLLKEKDIPEIWVDFGTFAFGSLIQKFRDVYEEKKDNAIFSKDVFDFVEHLNEIHFNELQKLYPKANFPRFEITRNGDVMTLIYSSDLALHYLVKGLLTGCIHFFDEQIDLIMEFCPFEDKQHCSKFTLKKQL